MGMSRIGTRQVISDPLKRIERQLTAFHQRLMSDFFFFFPAILLSGFMFSIENMPHVAQ